VRHLQPLEPRQLLSATQTNGLLSVWGTDQNDQINISRSKTTVTVTEKTIQVSGNQTIITLLGKHTFPVSGLGWVSVRTGAGNDSVTLTGGRTTPFYFPATLDGGDGADSLAGGAGADLLVGGNGDDRLSGGAGDDTLRGDAGNDRLSGMDGNDRAYGGAGEDNLTGGAGSDLLDGGLNNDHFYADDGIAGNDTLLGGGADIPAIPKKTSGDYAVIDLGDVIGKEPLTGKTTIRRVVTIAPV
jgi:Ca2+-binding RTX toxin-like protein